MSGCANCVLFDDHLDVSGDRPGGDDVDPAISAFLAMEKRLAGAKGGGTEDKH
jgi:hypothetical protein